MQCGIKCVRLQGSMSLAQRDTVIEAFSTDPGGLRQSATLVARFSVLPPPRSRSTAANSPAPHPPTTQTLTDVRIFLMSLKAGGVALNLTAASHCFLMDPW